MKIDAQNYNVASLEDYQREIHEVWPQLASRPALHTWARVVQHGTAACEGMRRSDWKIVLDEMAKTVVWWLAFIQKTNLLHRDWAKCVDDDDFVFALPLNATELIWRKYPFVCPVEFGLASAGEKLLPWTKRPGQRCTCIATKRAVEKRSLKQKEQAKEALRVFSHKNRKRCPKSIRSLEMMFRSIFDAPQYALSLEELFFHFIEEIGEVSEALANATSSDVLNRPSMKKTHLVQERVRKLRAIAEELADVFSWSVGIIAKIQGHLVSFENYTETRADGKALATVRKLLKGSQHIGIGDIVWQKYGLPHGELRCDVCNLRRCTCADHRARPLYKESLAGLDDRRKEMLIDCLGGIVI